MENIELKKEFEFYVRNQEELLKKYNGRYLVIKESKILGDYETPEEAIKTTVKDHEMGTFLVQKCSPGEEDYIMTFHSRVVFI